MKLFKNLPKKLYETPIGNVNLSSFYTFYQKNLKNKKTINTKIDKKTNLIEATKHFFDDSDSLWVALHTNNSINPFTFLNENNTLFIKENETKTTFNPFSSNTGYYNPGMTFNVPIGSILTQYSSNTGASWSYSSVGNFDLNGPFTIVERSDSYNKSVTVKPRKNLPGAQDILTPGTDGNIEETQFVFINKGSTYFLFNNTFYNKNTIKFTDSFVSQKNKGGTKEINVFAGSPEPLEESIGSFLSASETFESPTTISEFVETKSKSVTLISPSDLLFSMSSFITPKYSA